MNATGSSISMDRPAALITGAARRVGRAIAAHLASEGWDIGVHCRASRAEADRLARELCREGVECAVYAGDISRPEDCRRLIEDFCADFPQAALLVNNASVFERDTVDDLSLELWDRHLAVNARAPILLARHFHERAAAGGSIVNMLDQKVVNVTPDFFSYTISKIVLHQATLMLAQAFAPRTRVNGIAPALMLRSGDLGEAQFRRLLVDNPLGIAPSLDEICGAVSYLAASPAITGQVLLIDGGRHLIRPYPFEDFPEE